LKLNRVERLACDIAIDLANEPFIALCVLKGGYQFFTDLLDKIRQLYRYRSSSESPSKGLLDDTLDAQQIRVEFIRLKSYEDEKTTGNIKVIGVESLDSLRGKVWPIISIIFNF
jgi:hypoxanthine phosphoribosyltransferase